MYLQDALCKGKGVVCRLKQTQHTGVPSFWDIGGLGDWLE
jgi:hypothetical protein